MVASPQEASEWLDAHCKKDSAALASLLVNHPISDSTVEAFARALYAMPVTSVVPAVAHAVATNYGGLGALMEAMLDPTKWVWQGLYTQQYRRRTSGCNG